MQALRAYLITRNGNGDHEVTIHRDFNSLQEAWQVSFSSQVCGIIHIGFSRPSYDEFEKLLSKFSGILLLTESAKHTIPPPLKLTSYPIGKVETFQVYGVLEGWGYEASLDSFPKDPTSSPNIVLENQTFSSSLGPEWIALTKVRDHELSEILTNANIVDDQSYLAREGSLPSHIRLTVAKKRFLYTAGSLPNHNNILDQLKLAPPWVLSSPINALDLTIRASNIFRESSITTVNDLTKYSSDSILKLPKFGRTTLQDVSNELYQLFESGPPRIYTQDSTQSIISSYARHQVPQSLVDLFSIAFETLKESEAKIIKLRMGMFAQPKTLQEIGDSAVPIVTRERIRQIESKAVKKIKALPFWNGLIESRLEKLLTDRQDALPLLGLEILDPWFTKLDKLRHPFEYLLDKICSGRFQIIQHQDQLFVTTITQDNWIDTVKRGKQFLANSVNKSVTEVEAKDMMNALLIVNGSELLNELWTEVTQSAHFATNESGKSVLVSYGYGAEHLVHAVLTNAEIPLHYSEICKRANQVSKRTHDIRSVHNAASEVGLLLGRGIYGLQRHFPLNELETKILITEIEDLIRNGPSEKQWHCSGILDELGERQLDFDEKLTPYIIDIALEKSENLSSLRRMIWVSKTSNLKGSSNRIDVHQAIVSILRMHGRTMTSEEIRTEISKSRGLNYYFQIQPEFPLIRLGKALWGLIDRDLPITVREIEALLTEVTDILNYAQKGIHVSELYRIVQNTKGIITADTNLSFLAGIFHQNMDTAVDKGYYVYIRNWKTSRRLDLKSVVLKILSEKPGLNIHEIHAIVPKIIGRDIEKLNISQVLQHIEADYNDESDGWYLSDSNAIED